MQTIDNFVEQYRFLSNFYPTTVALGTLVWPSAEHAYQAAKSQNPHDWKDVMECVSPGAAKRMGRHITMRPDWHEIRLEVMEEIVLAKFSQNPVLATRLIETGDAPLIEGNHWGDTYWGVCRGVGQNHLGKILMNVREDLKIERIIDANRVAQPT